MYCQKCGEEIMDEAIICPKCGCATGNKVQNISNNGGSVTSTEQAISSAKTMSILSIVLGFLIPLAGWILGGIALSKTNSMIANGVVDERVAMSKSMSVVGLIVSTVIFLVAFAFLLQCY